jgi:hypothetical protein
MIASVSVPAFEILKAISESENIVLNITNVLSAAF